MKKQCNKILMLLLVGSISTIATGCSKSTPAAATTTRSYAGSGSDWRWKINSDGTFSGTESETTSTVSGTYTTSATGFIKATVSAKTGVHAPAVGSVLTGVEVPGFALLWAPILDTETQIVGTITAGTCPTANFTNNFLYVQFATDTDITDNSQKEKFGVLTYDVATGTSTVNAKYGIAGGYPELTVGNTTIEGSSCKDGIISNDSFIAYLSPAAGVVKVIEPESPSLGDALITMPRATLGSLAALDGKYAGFVYNETDSTPTRVVTGSLSAGALAVASVDRTDLITPDGKASGVALLTDVDAPSAGFIKGSVDGNPLICMGAVNVQGSGKNSLFCLGKNPTDKSPYALVLASF